MKEFIIKIALFITLIFASIYVALKSIDEGRVDAFYARFTSPKQTSLILGSSRAAQGFVPSELNNSKATKSIYNFSFTNANSPYGKVYYKAILKKLSPKTENGIFILEVNPWILSYSAKENPDEDESKFREVGKTLDATYFFNISPNIDYIINCYKGKYINLFTKPLQNMKLNKDGWLELDLDYHPDEIKDRIREKINAYKQVASDYKHSTKRMYWFEKIVTDLNKKGRVILVRIPVSLQMYELENLFWNNFDDVIIEFAKSHHCNYFNFIKQSEMFETTDGNHLFKHSAIKFSKQLSDSILMLNKPFN